MKRFIFMLPGLALIGGAITLAMRDAQAANIAGFTITGAILSVIGGIAAFNFES